MEHSLSLQTTPGRQKDIRQSLLCALASFSLGLPLAAHAADVLPGAYTPLPAGTDLVQVFYTYTERNQQVAQGNPLPINARFDSGIAQLRYMRFLDLGGYVISPNILVPFGKQVAKNDSAALGSAGGVSDTVLSATIWLRNDAAAKSYIGITPFLVLPTGDYDPNQALNPGENRWKFILQGGLNTPVADKVHFDLIGDVTVYGDNDRYGRANATLKQDLSYQLQTHLRYKFSPTTEVSLGASQVWGGETQVNGVKKNNTLKTTKLIIGGAFFLRASTQLAGTYSQDVAVDNGFKESNRFLMRVTQTF